MGSMSFKKRVSLILGLTIVLGLVVPMFAASGALAAEEPDGRIAGRVVWEGGVELTDSCFVRLYNADTGQILQEANVTVLMGILTPGACAYSFLGLDENINYKVCFVPKKDSKWDLEWYNDKPDMQSADVIHVTNGVDTAGIDGILEVSNGSIKGIVRGADTGNPQIHSFYVQAYEAASGTKVDEAWVWDQTGYEIKGLSPGQYKLLFDPRYPDDRRDCPYIAEWYDSKSGKDGADIVTVTGTEAVTIDPYLEVGGSISGTVTGEDGPPVEGCRVDTVDAAGIFVACDDTDASGNYKVQGMPAGTYRVHYTFIVMDEKYLGEWYNDKETQSEATPVTVTMAADTPNINAVLSGWGSVKGNVKKDEDNSNFEGVNVYVHNAQTGMRVSGSVTDASGNYEVKFIPTGTYTIKFVPGDNDDGVHMLEWYNNKPVQSGADTISVTAFEATSGINASLAPTGSISGNVIDENTGLPIKGIKVDAVDPVAHRTVRYSSTDADGNYKIGKLPNGTYKVQFMGGPNAALPEGSAYVAEWYDNKKTESTANTVTVSGTADTPNINGSLKAGGGIITGNVKSQDEAGNPPVEGCSVSAVDPATGAGRVIGTGKTDGSGNYKILGLPEGTYKVKFNPSPTSKYSSEWYNDKIERDTANDVTVIDLEPTSDINALLETTGKISGRVVSDEKGYPPLEGAWVFLYDANTGMQLAAHAVTDENGVYAIDRLNDGAYKVKFEAANQDPNEPEWYNNKAAFSKADTINLKAPDLITGINAALTVETTIGPPEIRANPVWYLAEGTTDWGFSTYFSIGNPNSTAVNVEINYMTENGLVYGGAMYLAPNSQATLNPDNAVPSQDFSTKFECREGDVITVDRTMTWTGAGAASGEGHCSTGVTTPEKSWYLPEGSTDWGFETWLLIQNPNSKQANCQVTYMIEGKGPQIFNKTVPPNSRRTYNMADDIGAEDASIKVTSDIGIIPERAMYRNNRREGHDSIGAIQPQMNYYLAEGTTGWGFTTYILVQNPNDQPASVEVIYMTSEGARYHPVFTMPPNSRQTIRVNDIMPGVDFSTQVRGSLPIIAERAMYWNNGTGEACHDSIGMSAPAEAFYLADGQTSVGRETWTLVQNPNDHDVAIQVTYMKPSGKGDPVFEDTIPAHSRRTYNMADAGIQDRAAVRVVCISGDKIMVERAMYWNNRGAGTDSIGSFEN